MNTKKNMTKYIDLCIKSVTGNISKSENEKLDLWLEKSSKNKDEYENIKKIWEKTLLFDQAEIPDIETEWEMLNDAIRDKENKKQKLLSKIFAKNTLAGLSPRFGLRLRYELGFAFTLIILAVAFFMWNKPASGPVLEITAHAGQQQNQFKLPDGSDVLLNYNSSLQYPETFSGDIREVKLTGEAFFSVTKEKHPFIVSTENAKTTVLGTKFDVWSRKGKTRVFVEQGIVKVVSKNNTKESVRLIKNQLSIVAGDLRPTDPSEVNAGFLLGWTKGDLVFENTPLPEIAGELNRYYQVPITLKNDSLKTYTLTGSFRKISADSVLTMICLALDLKYSKQNGGYLIETK